MNWTCIGFLGVLGLRLVGIQSPLAQFVICFFVVCFHFCSGFVFSLGFTLGLFVFQRHTDLPTIIRINACFAFGSVLLISLDAIQH